MIMRFGKLTCWTDVACDEECVLTHDGVLQQARLDRDVDSVQAGLQGCVHAVSQRRPNSLVRHIANESVQPFVRYHLSQAGNRQMRTSL